MTEVPPKIQKKPNRWFRKRTLVLPTCRTCLLLAIILFLFCEFAIRRTHPFLAITRPVPSTILVVEGWAPDYAYAQAIAEFHQGHYQLLVVTGGPFEQGAPLAEYKSYAELGAAILQKLGVGTNEVVAVPSMPVRQDRTYASALALKD